MSAAFGLTRVSGTDMLSCPARGAAGLRLFFFVQKWNLADGCCERRPPDIDGWFEVRQITKDDRHLFHWYERANGWVSFRRPGDVESHDARVSKWELRE